MVCQQHHTALRRFRQPSPVLQIMPCKQIDIVIVNGMQSWLSYFYWLHSYMGRGRASRNTGPY